MAYKILTITTHYKKDGITHADMERPFPKTFETEEAAKEFGQRFFEPPQTVKKWRIVGEDSE